MPPGEDGGLIGDIVPSEERGLPARSALPPHVVAQHVHPALHGLEHVRERELLRETESVRDHHACAATDAGAALWDPETSCDVDRARRAFGTEHELLVVEPEALLLQLEDRVRGIRPRGLDTWGARGRRRRDGCYEEEESDEASVHPTAMEREK